MTAYLAGLYRVEAKRDRHASKTATPAGSSPLVALVIPTHNDELEIGETVRRALELPYRPLSVIVADAGSTDGTTHMARSAAAGDPRLVIAALPPNQHAATRAALDHAYRILRRAHLDELPGPSEQGDALVGILPPGTWLSPNTLPDVAERLHHGNLTGVRVPVRVANARDSYLARLQDIDAVASSLLAQNGRDLLDPTEHHGAGTFIRLSALHALGDAPWTTAAASHPDGHAERVIQAWNVALAPRARAFVPAAPLATLLHHRSRRAARQTHRTAPINLWRAGARSTPRIDASHQAFLTLTTLTVTAHALLALATTTGLLPTDSTLLAALTTTPTGRALLLALACGPLALLTLLYQQTNTGQPHGGPPPLPFWALPRPITLYAASPPLLAAATALHTATPRDPHPPNPNTAPATDTTPQTQQEIPLT